MLMPVCVLQTLEAEADKLLGNIEGGRADKAALVTKLLTVEQEVRLCCSCQPPTPCLLAHTSQLLSMEHDKRLWAPRRSAKHHGVPELHPCVQPPAD